jgi:hypothetical protein
LQARLAEAAGRLNADEPHAPSLRQLTCGGRDRAGNVVLGRTLTVGWVNPAAISHGGKMTWNDFGSHRPGRVGELAAALLGDRDPADLADNIWAGPIQPVTLVRVPGPAGPLYEMGGNGQHRIHTARLLGFPMLWAIIDQFTLPTHIDWYGLVDWGEVATDEIRTTSWAAGGAPSSTGSSTAN